MRTGTETLTGGISTTGVHPWQDHHRALPLSRLVGADVRGADGVRAGRLVDLVITIGADHPPVCWMVIAQDLRGRSVLDWRSVDSFDVGAVSLSTQPEPRPVTSLPDGSLWLVRDVLDAQVVDVAGKRLARVSDVVVERVDHELLVVAVDVGAAAVWRRLGLSWMGRHADGRLVDWGDVHLASGRGHTLQLAGPDAAVTRLSPAELASVMAQLPTGRAVEILGAVPVGTAAQAVGVSHPRAGARWLRALPSRHASALLSRMATDDAAAVLRWMEAHEVDGMMANLESGRAATLQRLLVHRADTAGGLMNTDVLTADPGDTAETIRTRLAGMERSRQGLQTVFVVDAEGRPVGCFDPADLVTGRSSPRQVPSLPVGLPVDRVIDLFALTDYAALPVVDEEGRLAGGVAVDDVLEELLAERLPGRSVYSRIRRHRRPVGPGRFRRR